MKKNKNKNHSSLILRAFIVVAVVMMLLSIIPAQGEISEKNKNGLEEKVVSDDKAAELVEGKAELSEPTHLCEKKYLENIKEATLAETEKTQDLLDAANANNFSSNPLHQVQNIRASPETEKSGKSPDQGSISNDSQTDFNTGTLSNVTATSDGIVNLTYNPAQYTTVFSDDFEDDTAGQDPDSPPWTVHEGTSTNVAISNTVYHGGSQSCMLDDDGALTNRYCYVKSDAFTAVVTGRIEFWASCTKQGGTDGFAMDFYGSGSNAMNINFISSNISYYDGSNHNIQAYTEGQWYHFKLVFDCNAGEYDIYIDDMDTPAVSDALFWNADTGITTIEAETWSWSHTYKPLVYIDDIKIETGTAAGYNISGNITSATTTVSGTTNIDSAKVSWNASDTGDYEEQVANYKTGADANVAVYTSQYVAQSFIPDSAYSLTKVGLYIKTAGTPGTLTIKLEGSTGTAPSTKPDNNVLAQAASISTGGTSYLWVDFVWTTPYECTADTEYFIVAEGTGSSTTNCWVWYGQTTGAYANGDSAYSTNQGSSWTALAYDFYFRAYSEFTSFNVSVSNDNGDTWEDVTNENNTWHNFSSTGNQLAYKVYFYGNGSGTPKLDNIQIAYNYTKAANQTPTPTNLGVQGYTSSPGILNITNHTPTFNYTYTDPDGDPQSWRNVSVYNISSGTVIWYSNVSDGLNTSGSNITVTYNSTGTATADLQDGLDYYFNVTCNDTGSNNWSAVASVRFCMNSLPTALLSAPANDTWTNDNTPLFDWDYSDSESSDQSGFNVSIDNDPAFTSIDYWANQTSSDSQWQFPDGTGYSTLSDGTWYWRVKTSDSYEWGDWSGWRIIKIDTAKPTSNVSAISPYWQTSSITITAEANDTLSGVKNVTLYYYNSSDNSTFSGPWLSSTNETPTKVGANWSVSWSFSFPNGTQYYRFYSIARDNAMNTEDAPTNNDTLCGYDNLPPDQVILVSPTNLTNTNATTPTLTWNKPNDNGPSGIKNYRYQVANDSGFTDVWRDEYTTNTYYNPNLLEGYYYWRILARDNASNNGNWSEVWEFRVDTTLPDTTINPIADYINSLTSITGTASDNGGSGVNKTQIRIYNATGNTNWTGSDWSNTPVWLNATGYATWSYDSSNVTWMSGCTYTIYANTTDNATNVDATPANDTFGYDTTLPETAIDNILAYVSSLTSITGTASDSFSGVNKTQIRIYNVTGGANWTGSAWSNTPVWLTATGYATWSYNSSGITWMSGCSYTIYANATDNATNVGASVSDSFTYDTTSPTVNSTTPPNGGTTPNVWLNVSFSFNETMNTSITPTNSTNMSGTITHWWESNTTLWIKHSAALTAGSSYYVNISGVKDLAGNQLSGSYKNITFTVTSTNSPPVTTGVCPGDQAVKKWFNTPITINWTYYDPDNNSQSGVDIDYSTNSGGSWNDLYYSTGYTGSSWDWSNPPESGTLKVRVKTSDGLAWSSEWSSSTYDFGHDSVPPASSVSPISPYWNTTGTIEITVAVSDTTSGRKNATLYYMHSSDNISWGGWTFFSTDSSEPYVFTFNMPNGDGYYEFYSIAGDNAGNVEEPPASADAICGYDSTKPSSSVSPFSKYWFNQASVTVAASATDATSGVKNVTLWYRYSDDNSTWGGWAQYEEAKTSPFQWVFNWPNGTGHYQFYSIAADNVGHIEATPAYPEYDTVSGFDNIIPVCSISYPSNNSMINALNQINGTCSDTVSGINRVKLTINNTDNGTVYVSDAEATLSGLNWSYPWTPPYDGNYTVTATSFDNASNSKTVSIKFMFDKTTPTTSILVSGTLGTNNWYVSNVTVNLTASDKMSGIYSITYSIKGNETTVYAMSTTLILQETTTLYYWSADNAGNSETFKSVTIKIDKTKPSAPDLTSPGNNSWTNATIIVFNWENATDNISLISNYTLVIDNNSDFSSPEYTAVLNISENSTSLNEGVYYWKVTATDNAGNNNVSWVWVIKIDRVKPGNVTLIYPVGITINDTNQPNLTWTEAEDNLSGVKEYIIEIDEKGEGFSSPYILISVTNSKNLSEGGFSLPDAKYEWRVRAVDNASNYGEWSGIKEFTIETKAPTINKFLVNNGEKYTNNKSVILTINITNATIIGLSNDGSNWSYNITIEGYSFAGNVEWNLTEEDGKKTVYLRCKNMTAYSYISVSIILDQTAPFIYLISPDNDTWVNSAYVSFKWKAYDLTSGLNGTCHIQISTDKAFSDIVYENNSVAGSWVNNETSSYSYQFSSDNIYYWRIIMKDNASNYNYSGYRIVKVDATPPTTPGLVSPENNSVINNSVVTFIWSSITDFSGIANYLIQIDNDFDFSSPLHSVYLDTNSTSFNLTDGAWYWKVKATDNAGNTGNFSVIYKFTVNTGRPSNLRIEINAGANETNTEEVYLAIYAENASEMLISNYEDVWDGSWINYTTLYEWKLIYLSPGSAPVNRTVWIKFRNKNGESLTINDAILLNKKPPVVVINETCSIINETSITLYWHLSDEGESDTIHHFEVSNRYGAWIDVGLSRSYTFESLSQGYHVFYVRGWYKDETTPGGADSLPVLVDALKPSFTSIEIWDGSGYTNSTSVQLHIHAVDNQSEIVYVSGIHKLFISNDNTNWVEYEYNLSPVFLDAVLDWNLLWNGINEDGNKTIYFKLVDRALNVATTTKVIFLDRVSPTSLSITIVEGDYTNSTSVNLILNASDPGSGVWKMSFSENGVNWSDWVDYSTGYIYQLQSTTEELKTIYFRVKDRAGNWDWNQSSANITLDLTKPIFTSLTQNPLNLTEDSTYFNITVTIIEGNLGTTIPSLIYRIGEGTEGTVRMKLLSGKTFYYNLTGIDFNASQGKNLYYRIRCFDLAGNVNTTAEKADYISQIPDTPELIAPDNYAIIATNTTVLTWAKNTTDPGWYSVEYLIEYDDNINFTSPASYQTNTTQIQISGLAHNTTYYWHVRALNVTLSPWSQTHQFTVKLPDLSVAKILFEPSDTIPVETTVLVNVTINNIGESDAENVSVSFYKKHPHEIGSAHIDTITVLRIRKGDNVTVQLPYYQSSPEDFSIWVWVDSDSKIVEIREDNNLLSGIVHFVSPLDVLPINITFSVNGAEPSYIFENDDVTITAEIINLGGDIKIPFWVEFWFGDFENDTFNGSFIGKAKVEKILTGGIGSVSINWNADVGDYKIWVFLNTTSLPNENAENNWFNKTFIVNFPTLLKIDSSQSLLTTDPSGTLSYTITITNIGQINDTYNLTVEDLPSGWDYSFIYNGREIKNVTLNPGEKIDILLRVKGGGEPGTYSFRVVASSQKDPRAMYEMELSAKIKEPFPWYLLIIAVVAAVIITVIGLLVKKGVIVVKAKPVKVESGYNYLIKGTDVGKPYSVFVQLTKKTPGLCITSTHPRKRRDEYKLSCPVYWLTDVTKTDEKTLHPERLDFELFKTVSDFVKEKHGVIMLDGLEYLVHVNGFERTMDFIDSIRDTISTHNGTLIVPANPSVFKEEELGMLEKRFDRILG